MKKGLDEETIYARLEKQGIPHELVEKVVGNVFEERNRKSQNQLNEKHYISLIVLLIGLFTGIASIIFFPGILIVPIGLIIGGIFGLIRSNRR